VCAALLRAKATGEGAFLDVSMLDATLATMGWVVSNYLNAGVVPRPIGNDNFTAAPSGTFRTGNGLLNIAANEDRQFEALCRVIGAPDLATDVRFAEREARKRHRAELTACLEPLLASRSAADWEAILEAAGVPAGGVLGLPEILGHPHVAEAGLLARFRDVPGVPRDVHVTLPGFRIDGSRPGPATRPPTPSEQRDQILEQAGYDAAARRALVEVGAVR
jgi:crotonobetainyl-CoA:carnitine CoA-transferase CaiB-like acyl-CoA transferase